jgi:hypothetical protein
MYIKELFGTVTFLRNLKALDYSQIDFTCKNGSKIKIIDNKELEDYSFGIKKLFSHHPHEIPSGQSSAQENKTASVSYILMLPQSLISNYITNISHYVDFIKDGTMYSLPDDYKLIENSYYKYLDMDNKWKEYNTIFNNIIQKHVNKFNESSKSNCVSIDIKKLSNVITQEITNLELYKNAIKNIKEIFVLNNNYVPKNIKDFDIDINTKSMTNVFGKYISTVEQDYKQTEFFTDMNHNAKLSLGIGLGIGIPLLIFVIFYFFMNKNFK